MFPGTPPVHRGITCLRGSLAEAEELGPGLLLALSPPHLLREPTALPGPGRANWPHSRGEPGLGALIFPVRLQCCSHCGCSAHPLTETPTCPLDCPGRSPQPCCSRGRCQEAPQACQPQAVLGNSRTQLLFCRWGSSGTEGLGCAPVCSPAGALLTRFTCILSLSPLSNLWEACALTSPISQMAKPSPGEVTCPDSCSWCAWSQGGPCAV